MIPLISMLIGTSIASPMILHLRADTGVVLDHAGKVSEWKDLSPRHSDFVTTNFGTPRAVFVTRYHDTAAKRVYKTYASDSVLRPRLAQNGIGGKASVVFDGQQALVNSSALPLDSGFTLFAIAQDSTGNGYAATLVDKGPGDFNTDLPNGWADSINGCFNIGLAWVKDIAKSNFETSNPTLYESSWNGETGSLWANGRFLASGQGSNPTQRNQSTWIGGVINPHGDLQNFLTGRISEIRIYAGELDGIERKKIEDSLMARYGIGVKPPKQDRRILHLRADTGLVLDASGRIATWKDLSPRHTDFVTPNLDKPELLFLTPYVDNRDERRFVTLDSAAQLRPWPESTCALGNNACIRFDGANTLTDTTSLPLDSGFTMFIVAQDSSEKGAFTALVDKGPGDMNTDLWTGIDGNFQMGIGWVDNIAQSQLETPEPTVYASSFNGMRGNLWANGRMEGTGTTEAKPVRNKNTWLGAVNNQYPVLMGFLTGRIYEVRIYSGVLDSTERKAINDSLMCRYGIGKKQPKPDRRILHLRADTSLILDASGRIATWHDLSPRHTDFVTPKLGKPELLFLTPFEDIREKRRYATLDADSLLRPHLEKDCTIGSGSCVRFDGANTLVDTTSLPLDSGFTMFIVAQDSSGKGAFTALLDKGPNDLNTDLWTGVDGNFQMGIGWVDNIAQTQFETTRPTLYGSSYDSGRGRIWVNGRLEGSGTTQAKPVRNKNTWLGATYNQYPVLMGFLTGRIYEIRIYSGALDSTERKAIEKELVRQYGVALDSSTAGLGRSQERRIFHRFTQQGILEISGVNEGSATLIGLDGRIIASSGIHNGQARLPRFHGSALLAIKSTGFSNTELVLSP